MDTIEVRIRFPEVGDGAELEIIAPASSNTEACICDALQAVPVRHGSPYVVNAGKRLIASIRLGESDGGRLSPAHARQVIDALRARFAASPDRERADEPTRWYDTGAYPRAQAGTCRGFGRGQARCAVA
jgi:hypothetical protein